MEELKKIVEKLESMELTFGKGGNANEYMRLVARGMKILKENNK